MGRPGSRFHKRLSSAKWERVRWAKLKAAGWRCERCGGIASEVHHIRPLHRGGAAFDPANLASRCRRCHVAEHARKLSEPERQWAALVAELAGEI